MKILLIEDHAVVADMTTSLLREMYDYEVEHASTGVEALRITERYIPDVMLIDINLPDTNGYELAKGFRTNPAFDRTVLVALTGWGSIVDSGLARESGFDAHFRKPMDFDLLPTLRRQPT